jgi:hypothetical protein
VKVACGLLTYNAFATGRDGLFKRTLEVLKPEFPDIYIFTYGSTDGTGQEVEGLGGTWVRAVDPVMRTRYHKGYQMMGDLLYGTGADIILIHPDDLIPYPSFADAVTRWWTNAPRDIAITSWQLEPIYSWNEFYGFLEYGGIKGYWRAAAGGCSWSFRRDDWPWIRKWDLFEDIEVCTGFIKKGRKTVQIDWGEHVGEKISSWGNKAYEYAIPLTPETLHVHDWNEMNAKAKDTDGFLATCKFPGCQMVQMYDKKGKLLGLGRLVR